MKRPSAAFCLCSFLGVLLGLLVGYARVLKLDPNINAGHIINAVATICVGLILNQIYNRRASTRNIERQLLLAQIGEASAALTEPYDVFFNAQSEGSSLKRYQNRLSRAERRRLSNSVHSIEVALSACEVDAGKAFDSVKEARFRLKEALTDDPFPAGSFTGADASKIQGAFAAMRDETTRLAFAVNKACD